MRPFFRNPRLEKHYRTYGYVRLPWSTAGQVEDLKRAFIECHPQPRGGFHTTGFETDPVRKQAAFNTITYAFRDKLEKTMVDFRPLMASFLVKEPGSNSELHPHQDWSFADEEKFRTFNIWMPLVDTDANNGMLWILPCTHHLPVNRRYAPDSSIIWPRKGYWYDKFSLPLRLKAGEAVIYDNMLIHWSGANRGTERRMVAGALVVPDEAETCLFALHRPGSHVADALPAQSGFFVEYPVGTLPERHGDEKKFELGNPQDPTHTFDAVMRSRKWDLRWKKWMSWLGN